MIRLEFLLEEPSMQYVLDSVLSRLVTETSICEWRLHPHQGKQNLLKQLPKILRGYSSWITASTIEDDYHIVIIVDQDQDDCHELKQRIVDICHSVGLIDRVTARIVVTMLETWFLGDPLALEATFPKLKRQRIGGKAVYRQPENRPHPAKDLGRELRAVSYKDGYLKLSHAQQIAPHLSLEPGRNRSHSFNITIDSIRSLLLLS